MNISKKRDIKLLSVSFLLIFLGYTGVQQYVVLYFSGMGYPNLGFQSLILVYVFFAIFNPIAAMLVSKYGAKRCMIISSAIYCLFILTLLSKSAEAILIISALLGIAAAMLWTGKSSYLIRASNKKEYGLNSGFFGSLNAIGGMAGIFALGLLVSAYHFEIPFLLFSAFPIIGMLLLFGLKDIRPEKKPVSFGLMKKCFVSKTALILSSIWLVTSLVSGLTLGIIPIQIQSVFGVAYVGFLMAFTYFLQIIGNYFFGKLSDLHGRRKLILMSYSLLIIGLFCLFRSQQPAFLLIGIFLLTLNTAIITPVAAAFIGDVSNENNLEFLTAMFSTVQKIGVVGALLMSQLFWLETANIYLACIILSLCSLAVLLPLFSKGIEEIREKLGHEVN